jgi:hypothetical protein
METVARAAYLKEGIPFPFTTNQIINALGNCVISDGTFDAGEGPVPESPFQLMDRLGLKFVGTAL